MIPLLLRFLAIPCLLVAVALPLPAAQDDVADVPSEDLQAGKDKHKRYFLIGPLKGEKVPKAGHPLVVVMPGGPGTADFLPFVKRIRKNALPKGYLVAQPVAVKWTQTQNIVWPTSTNKVEGMQFTTEEFIEAVIADVAKKHKIDPRRIFTLSWSSSGPAAYAVSLTSKKVTGSFVAMSVFNPKFLPALEKAKGHAYYLYHSKADRICPYRMAAQAEKDLEKAGATVKLVEYDGGHGWRGNVFGDIREGIRWLEKNHAKDRKVPEAGSKE
jgi:predicted esterase